MTQDLVLLRYRDQQSNRLTAMCRPKEMSELMRSVLAGLGESDAAWLRDEGKAAVIVAPSGSLLITSPSDLHLLSFWFSLAAAWMETEQEDATTKGE
jgi:hypothetical protein